VKFSPEKDRRLLVVVGPCSIHDPKAAREYAGLLKQAIDQHSNQLCIAMRIYFEEPRTTLPLRHSVWTSRENPRFLPRIPRT
jgi:phospho-2-dehydro-3-deoxyheptonate aldolase